MEIITLKVAGAFGLRSSHIRTIGDSLSVLMIVIFLKSMVLSHNGRKRAILLLLAKIRYVGFIFKEILIPRRS